MVRPRAALTAGGVTGEAAWLSSVPEEARAYQGHRAGVVSRVLAAAIDLVVLFVLLGGAYFGLAGLLFVIDPVSFRFPAIPRAVILIAGGLVLVGYLTECWTTTGRTVGDRVLGLRVVDNRGRKLKHGRAALRALFCAVFPIGLLWTACSADRRSVQDLVMRTAVIYDWGPHHHGDAPSRR
ncbi:MAG TPA: RDD family protein [Actinophytocola sp.]|uniref:RDD family protein n=1 Tax=Actinophytocola sp. TaxID=1872138 RepID=UPI002F95A175